MKNFINGILRFLVNIALHGYFRKIIISGRENIPKGKPVILVANHQNALIDPLLLATSSRLNPWFLTRASVFKNPFIAKLLNFIRMLPVYRVRDGFSTVQQNQEIFEKTYRILSRNGTVVIFAEGSHSLVRNLRPLSKGFTRMAFGLKEKHPELTPLILPVGLDFSAHKRSGSQVKITYGKPIPVDMPPAQSGKLTKLVEKSLGELIVSIPNEKYEENLNKLLDHQIDLISRESVAAFLNHLEVRSTYQDPSGLKNKVMKIFHFPLYWIWLWMSPKIEDKVFDSTFKFLIGFVGAPVWYLCLILLTLNTSFGAWALTWLIMAIITIFWNKNPQE
ncbi:1-acyl-sn-glycerol-3-phosphate acyltransferase [Algoriphagus mannitolivorans]|uniref:1-acyl-sn-glycerol-3-phosphate acyltransferase n=1 Tax=Algoriphagus mannitolivorans TaxID=226504 RepID=UPI00047B6854|nr:1-acyl-sn-glycerol-3-phosphate acyltransferase [Algoriphagus mannitolivorans]